MSANNLLRGVGTDCQPWLSRYVATSLRSPSLYSRLGDFYVEPVDAPALRSGVKEVGCRSAIVIYRLPGALSAVMLSSLSVGRQECQQALGEPGTGLVGVKARLAQRGRPVTSEVDGNHARSAVAVASRSASVVIGMRARQDLRPG